jgi:hypothetical protein
MTANDKVTRKWKKATQKHVHVHSVTTTLACSVLDKDAIKY